MPTDRRGPNKGWETAHAVVAVSYRFATRLMAEWALAHTFLRNSLALGHVGETGLRIVRAIVPGERDRHRLAALRNPRIHACEEEVARAVEGTWRPEIYALGRAQRLPSSLTPPPDRRPRPRRGRP